MPALDTSVRSFDNGKRDYFGNKENSDRLVLVGQPSLDPSPYLDELGRNVFQNPLSAWCRRRCRHPR